MTYEEAKDRMFVNFCNMTERRNIFTNAKQKDARDNFENVMAIFQEKGVIRKPQRTDMKSPFLLDLTLPLQEQEPLFEARAYRKKMTELEKLAMEKGGVRLDGKI